MSAGQGFGAANNAAVTVDNDQQSPSRQVELGDGWSISAESDEALKAKVEEKLKQARRSRDTADRAIKHWIAVADDLA